MKSTSTQQLPDKAKIAKMTGGAGGGLGRIEKSAVAPKTGAGKTGKAL